MSESGNSSSGPSRRTILILEDNADRIRGFEAAVTTVGHGLFVRLWCDAPTMISECEACFKDACLISLDHDSIAQSGVPRDPGTGLEVAEFLARRKPICPVILHTSNNEGRWSMHNELRFAGWNVEIVGPLEPDWIHRSWMPRARSLAGL